MLRKLKQLSPFLLPTLISLTFLVILGNLSRILKEKVEIIQLFQARLVEERARLQQETELFVAVVNNRLTILQNEYKDIMENQLKNQQGDEGINNKYFMQDPEAIHQTNISELRVKLRQLIESTIDLKIQMEEQNRWREVLDDNTYKKNLLARLEDSQEPEVIHNSNLHVILDNIRVEQDTTYKILVLLSSGFLHFENRKIIRESWANQSMWTTKHQFKVIFVVGTIENTREHYKQLVEESKIYKDIMMEDVDEEYYKLSYKVMISLQWAHNSFKFDFLLKGDDDIYVNIDEIMKRLETDLAGEGCIGNVMSSEKVNRHIVPKEMYANDVYEPFCSGAAVFLSRDTVSKMIPHFDWVNPLVVDDAYIGTLVHKAGVKIYDISRDTGFYMLWNYPCEYRDNLVVSHPVKKKKCMDFLMNHTFIRDGRIIDDELRNQTHGYTQEEATPPSHE